MTIEIIITSVLILFVVIVLWLARKHNIHVDYDATGLEAHPKEALKFTEDPSSKNIQKNTQTSLDKKTTD